MTAVAGVGSTVQTLTSPTAWWTAGLSFQYLCRLSCL